MKFVAPDKSDPRWGRQSGEYRIAKLENGKAFLIEKDPVDDGALCTLYRLWYQHEHLGWFADFQSARAAAEGHLEALKGTSTGITNGD
jgi:hypothetical protein